MSESEYLQYIKDVTTNTCNAVTANATKIKVFGYISPILFCTSLIVFILALPISKQNTSMGITLVVIGFFGFVAWFICKCALGSRKRYLLKTNNDLLAKEKNLIYIATISYLSTLFEKTTAQIEYDLIPILNPTLNDWYMTYDKVKVVVHELETNYKLKVNTVTQSDLSVKNLELQNEGIAIDNTQKQFWRCESCGNLNRADDMACPACGGRR